MNVIVDLRNKSADAGVDEHFEITDCFLVVEIETKFVQELESSSKNSEGRARRYLFNGLIAF